MVKRTQAHGAIVKNWIDKSVMRLDVMKCEKTSTVLDTQSVSLMSSSTPCLNGLNITKRFSCDLWIERYHVLSINETEEKR